MHRVPSGCDFSTTPRPQCDLLEAAGSARPARIVRSGLGVLISMTVAAAMMLSAPTNALAQTAEADKEAAEKAKTEAEKSPEQQELERRAQIDSRQNQSQRENENRRSGRDPRTGAAGRVVPPNAAAESKRFAPPAPVAGKPTPQPTSAAAAQVPPPSATSTPGAAGGKPASGAPTMAQPQPAAGAPAHPVTIGGLKDDYFTFSSFSEPIDLAELVDFVQAEMNLQIIKTDAGLRGQTVVMSTPVTLHKDDVIRFLVTLLELRDYTMIQDRTGVYVIQDKNRTMSGSSNSEFSPTRIIPTPGIRPSTLTATVTGIVTAARGAGAPPPPNTVTFLDDVGVIVIAEPPRITRAVEEFVAELIRERSQVRFHRLQVTNIAASSAKDRILDLIGVATRSSAVQPGQPGQVQQQQQTGGASFGGTLSNMGERLIIEQGSNSLVFRGRDEEKDQVEELLTMVDVVGSLLTQWYPVGNATTDAVAAEGRRQQLGDSVTFEPSDNTTGTGGFNNNRAQGQNTGIPSLQGGTTELAGSGFILYPESGGFVYRGTPEQHRRVVGLIEQLRDLSRSEEIVYEFYKLKHGKSEEIATTLQDLITSTQSASSSPLLGNNLGNRNARDDRNNRNNRNNNRNQPQQPAGQNSTAGLSGEGSVGEIDGEEVFVTADEPNNQIVVKAPLKLQPQIRRLIEKLDLRRPQVYIEAMIVSVSDSENFRLAVEAQGIIGQWAFNTNFGLGSLTTSSGGDNPTTSGGITSRKNVATDLGGLTTAIVRSKDVPLVVTALQNNTDARIVAKPQLLVDDNVEAEVQSRDQQPTTESNQNTSTTTTSFSGYEDAGPRLRVTPQISEGGYMKLEYEIEISSFQGDPQSPGVPPAKQTNTISSESVTVPSDMTIVVGGLTQQSNNDIVIKVPLLGDIPLVGHLFRDTRKNERNITFFVFITPKIMRDPSFDDLRLLSRGPLDLLNIELDVPDPVAESSEIYDPRWIRPDGSTELDSPATGTIPGSMPVRRIDRTPADVLPPEQSRTAPGRVSHQPPVRPPVVAPEPHPDVPPPAAEESTYEDPSVRIEDVPAGR